jgi:branched-chain amino acid transport system permease protein
VQQIADGVTVGSIYGALAIALVLSYRATGLINFAQGQMAVVSAYIAWSLHSHGFPVGLSVAAALVASFAIGALTERLVIRRLRRVDALAAIVGTIGMLICFNGLVSLIWGGSIMAFPSLFPPGTVHLGSVRLTSSDMAAIGLLVVVVAALLAFLRLTPLGLALRAVADDSASCQLLGLPVGWLLQVGWGLAAVVGGLAGCLVAPSISLQPDMMDTILVYALAAAVLGGLESPVGALVAAWFIGISQNLAATYVGFIGNDLSIAVPLVVTAIVLLIRPQGLFGHAEIERV